MNYDYLFLEYSVELFTGFVFRIFCWKVDQLKLLVFFKTCFVWGAEYLYLQKTRVWFFVDKSKDGLLLAKGIDPIGTKSILMKGRVVHYSKRERLGKTYVSLELNPNHSTDCVCFHARNLQGCGKLFPFLIRTSAAFWDFKGVQLNDVMEFRLIESERGVVAVDVVKIHQQAEIARNLWHL